MENLIMMEHGVRVFWCQVGTSNNTNSGQVDTSSWQMIFILSSFSSEDDNRIRACPNFFATSDVIQIDPPWGITSPSLFVRFWNVNRTSFSSRKTQTT
jgi:hypothetical protein